MIPLGIMASAHHAAASGDDPLAGFPWVWRFEADAITGVADGGVITTWPDTSGNSRHATTAGDRYTLDADGFGTVPSVLVANSGESMATEALGSPLTQPTTIWLVCKSTTGPVFDGIVSTARHLVDRYNNWQSLWAGSGYRYSTLTEMSGVYCYRFDTDQSRSWMGGGASINGSVGTHQLTGLTLGTYYNSNAASGANIGAVMVVNAAQSLADINVIGNHLAAKYGQTWSAAT